MYKYYGPTHTYRFEVRGFGPAFFTDDMMEAIEEALFRSKYTFRTILLIDVDTDTIYTYRDGRQIL